MRRLELHVPITKENINLLQILADKDTSFTNLSRLMLHFDAPDLDHNTLSDFFTKLPTIAFPIRLVNIIYNHGQAYGYNSVRV
jgi:hypothetical protein